MVYPFIAEARSTNQIAPTTDDIASSTPMIATTTVIVKETTQQEPELRVVASTKVQPVTESSSSTESLVREYAEKYQVDVSLALNIACSESRFQSHVKNPGSSAGGVFQFIDSTWRTYSIRYWGEVRNKYDRIHNIELAILVLRDYGPTDWNASRHYWETLPYERGKCT